MVVSWPSWACSLDLGRTAVRAEPEPGLDGPEPACAACSPPLLPLILTVSCAILHQLHPPTHAASHPPTVSDIDTANRHNLRPILDSLNVLLLPPLRPPSSTHDPRPRQSHRPTLTDRRFPPTPSQPSQIQTHSISASTVLPFVQSLALWSSPSWGPIPCLPLPRVARCPLRPLRPHTLIHCIHSSYARPHTTPPNAVAPKVPTSTYIDDKYTPPPSSPFCSNTRPKIHRL